MMRLPLVVLVGITVAGLVVWGTSLLITTFIFGVPF